MDFETLRRRNKIASPPREKTPKVAAVGNGTKEEFLNAVAGDRSGTVAATSEDGVTPSDATMALFEKTLGASIDSSNDVETAGAQSPAGERFCCAEKLDVSAGRANWHIFIFTESDIALPSDVVEISGRSEICSSLLKSVSLGESFRFSIPLVIEVLANVFTVAGATASGCGSAIA